MAVVPCSRGPTPVALLPPNGSCASPPGVPLLTWTMPVSMPSMKRKTRRRVAREDRRREAEADGVGGLERLLEAVHADDRDDGAEDLLLRDAHRGRHAVEHRRLDEVAVGEGVAARAAAAADELRALALADARRSCRTVSSCDASTAGPMSIAGIEAVADAHLRRRAPTSRSTNASAIASLDDHARGGGAALAGGAEGALRRRLDGERRGRRRRAPPRGSCRPSRTARGSSVARRAP